MLLNHTKLGNFTKKKLCIKNSRKTKSLTELLPINEVFLRKVQFIFCHIPAIIFFFSCPAHLTSLSVRDMYTEPDLVARSISFLLFFHYLPVLLRSNQSQFRRNPHFENAALLLCNMRRMTRRE